MNEDFYQSLQNSCAENEGNDEKIEYETDSVLDSSMYAIFSLGLLPVDDHRVMKTMDAIEQELWVNTDVGGLARYTNDYYHQIVKKDIKKVPGNPWFICSLWLAEYYISRAKQPYDLRRAIPILEWVSDHSLASGVLAEQVDPITNAPLSVSPLTWSHATVVSTINHYISKFKEMTTCPTCGQQRHIAFRHMQHSQHII